MGGGELPYGTLVADLILKDFLRRMGKKKGRSHRFNNQSQVLKPAGMDLSAEREKGDVRELLTFYQFHIIRFQFFLSSHDRLAHGRGIVAELNPSLRTPR
ncbi:MAG: hypothetical protein PHS17_16245 [Desulfobacterales bacterium]|nr:hypothetical protein [Desulfobacterales bacterium]